MNLHFQMAVENHTQPVPSVPKKITSYELVNRQKTILAQQNNKFTPDKWTKEWLKSKVFYLLDFPLNKAAIVRYQGTDRILASTDVYLDNADPIVIIDINKKRLGETPNFGYVPPVIVVEGSHVHKAARMNGRGTVKAWVGELVATKLKLIQADHDIGNNELQTKLNECLRRKFPPKKDNIGMGGPYPWIQEVYALENYFIYSLDGDQYKQKFEVGDDREPTLKGEPSKVRVAYVEAGGPGSGRHSEHGTFNKDEHKSGSGWRVYKSHSRQGYVVHVNDNKNTVYHGRPGVSSKDKNTFSDSKSMNEHLKTRYGIEASISMPANTIYSSSPRNYFNLNEVIAIQAGAQPRHGLNYNPSEMSPGSGVGSRISNHDLRPPKQKRNVNSESEKIDKLLVAGYAAACKAGYKPVMKSVAPPGLENMVKGLKPKVGEESAYKIAWWKHNQGK